MSVESEETEQTIRIFIQIEHVIWEMEAFVSSEAFFWKGNVRYISAIIKLQHFSK